MVAIVRDLQGVKGERNFPLAKYTCAKPGYCLLIQRNHSRPQGQTWPPHHKYQETHAKDFIYNLVLSRVSFVLFFYM